MSRQSLLAGALLVFLVIAYGLAVDLPEIRWFFWLQKLGFPSLHFGFAPLYGACVSEADPK